MLMQERSGLTGIQVKQKQFAQVNGVGVLAPALQLKPLLILATGLGLVADALFDAAWIGIALAVLITVTGGLSQWRFARWLAQFNAHQTVLVVREGLLRATDVTDLVAGDLVQVQAGTLLPVDVLTPVAAQPTGWLRVVLALTGQQVPTGIALAGSRLLADARVEVLAVADNRFIAQGCDALMMTGDTGVLAGLTDGVKTLIAAVARQAQVTVRMHRNQVLIAQPALAARMQAQVLMRVGDTRAPLVRSERHDAKEAAFRYNQDPVSWRFS
ncbi:hypothetical protein [Lacticaseibacillus daqingensis]|uniref:hypothetical protein n=1 Tax=Lacticaseibacillus daqingensis TaxID=2486014 RepID=UPI000F76DC0B|nr:hypothetical protein [Lacticaseibacillus daqingensis]